jgi:glycosyltransferase involved in cell wall biosynthesis
VGGGEPGLLAALRDQAAKEFPSTEFLGPKHGAELAAWFAKADVLVLPGLGGLAVQEAMASGVPVIVADGDGTQEDLVDGATGWNVKPDDVDALVTAIADALSDRDRLRRMGSAAFVRVRDQINVDTMAGKVIFAVNKVRAMAGGVAGCSPSTQPTA